MPWFTTLDARRLSEEIRQARSRVILAAPGIWAPIADALIDAANRLGEGNVVVVVDAAAHVARLGFGEFGAIERLRSAGLKVRQHHGLRLGILVCDRRGWSFAMAPALVEKDPTLDTDAFNAVALTEMQVEALICELPPTVSTPASGGEPFVGTETVDEDHVAKVTQELKHAPPQDFDLSRHTSVYVSLVQFVELDLPGFKPGARQVQLPASLSILETDDKEVAAKITAKLSLLGSRKPPKQQEQIRRALEGLRKQFLIPVGSLGRVILKSRLPEFTRQLAFLTEELMKCREGIQKDLEASMTALIDQLSRELGKIVHKHGSLCFRMAYPDGTAGDAEAFVRRELEGVIPNVGDWVSGIDIRVHYKDVTYLTLKDEQFIERLAPHLPAEMRELPLVKEFLAVGSRRKVQRETE